MTAPLCPVTGAPPLRLVQWVSAELLAALWRYEFGADARPSFRGVTRFGLWESPTGLRYFDPPLEGDGCFYQSLQEIIDGRPSAAPQGLVRAFARLFGVPGRDTTRAEFRLAASRIPPGSRVLDVGCGPGAFRRALGEVEYVGLDPHYVPLRDDEPVRAETLARHLETHADSYDAVCAFQVLEHVARPVPFLAEMARAAKPGAVVLAAVPHAPSAHSRIPNYLINAPPHHLTWWTGAALLAAAERAGLADPAVEVVPWSELDAIVYWMARCSPVKCLDEHYRHRWSWHASAALGFAGSLAMRALRPVPPSGDEGAALLLSARRPDGEAG